MTNCRYLVLENSLDLLEQVPLNLCILHKDASSLVLLADELDQAFELNSSVAFAFGREQVGGLRDVFKVDPIMEDHSAEEGAQAR